MICSHCNNTGDLHGMGFYDCTNCPAADERTALDAAIAALPPMVKEDVHWAAYQAGVKAAEQRFAAERTELVAALYTMRGWAMSEVIADGDPDWALDMAKTNVLLKKNMGGKAWKS